MVLQLMCFVFCSGIRKLFWMLYFKVLLVKICYDFYKVFQNSWWILILSKFVKNLNCHIRPYILQVYVFIKHNNFEIVILYKFCILRCVCDVFHTYVCTWIPWLVTTHIMLCKRYIMHLYIASVCYQIPVVRMNVHANPEL
jgi:hypothetical protein